ncbi:glycoside hydrolase family 65 protein [Lactococcus ileimucosae]|uniref:Glycoside hydrolase family 65 protein n=1 Tax=Lactococcus ileimucosae TaxID=2941329 RepID=A0ABV4D1R9_9LACT
MKNFELRLEDLGNTSPENIETLFAQANGFMGIRASEPIATEKATPGVFVNGFYETHEIIYGENAYGYAKHHETMIKLFDLRRIDIEIDGEALEVLKHQERCLDMHTGLLHEKFVYETVSGKQIMLTLESFASHADRQVYAQHWTISALNFSGQVKITKKAQLIQPQAEKVFDPRVREASTKMHQEGNCYQTLNSQLKIYVKFDAFEGTIDLREGQDVMLTQLYQISKVNHFETHSYEALKKQQIEIFEAFWESSDIEINGDDVLQKGIRVNLFHLFNSAGRDGKTNFGAKGLTGEGYEGHYFWDTEMYLLPFFIHTQPELAKQLLAYRLHILPAAQARAAELDFKGALYPWRTISGQETSAYFPAGTGQVHINADIAYAFKLYHKVTGDDAFMEKAKSVIYETANFWLSYGFFSSRGFEIHEVTGPDEYTVLVNNNYYTNKMAQQNLKYAAELAQQFGDEDENSQLWAEAAQKMYFVPVNEAGITPQDESFLTKEVWNFEATPSEKYPLLLHYHPMKIYKHQVLKQADTLLAHMLFADETKREQMARDFDYYEALTTHDSSLSRAVYGVVASHLGRHDLAYDFFKDAATMDLTDLQGNAGHGIHAANMGGSWLGLIYGFAGLHRTSDGFSVKNNLPQAIKGLRFKIKFKGQTKIFEIGEIAHV